MWLGQEDGNIFRNESTPLSTVEMDGHHRNRLWHRENKLTAATPAIFALRF
jgi:hypothetical protein